MSVFSSRPLLLGSFLGTIVVALFVSPALAQPNLPPTERAARDAIVVPGDPPLTEGMVSQLADFDAWVLELPPSTQRRAFVRSKLAADWTNPIKRQADLGQLTFAATLAKATPDDLMFVKWFTQRIELQTMRADPSPYAQSLLAAYDQAHPALVAGNPPLTQSLIDRFDSFLRWVLEIPSNTPLDVANQMGLDGAIKSMLVADWTNPAKMKSDIDFLTLEDTLATVKTTEERDYRRAFAQAAIMNNLRAKPGAPVAQELIRVFDVYHPAIAPGKPPLTRQAADATITLDCFLKNQIGTHVVCDRKLRDRDAQELAKTFPSLPADQQKAIADAPRQWAGLQYLWSITTEAEHETMRARWRPADPRSTAAMAAAARVVAFGKREAKNVSESELLAAANDARLVAREERRIGTPEQLKNAAAWDKLVATFSAGKVAYVKQAEAAAKDNDAVQQVLMDMAVRMVGRQQRDFSSTMFQLGQNAIYGGGPNPLSAGNLSTAQLYDRFSKW